MITFICSDKHLSAIVKWAAMRHLTTVLNDTYIPVASNEQAIVQRLYDANRSALIERYEGGEDVYTHPADWLPSAPCLTAVECLKACRCCAYQCADWTGWNSSEARRFLVHVENAATNELPGYTDARWHIK